MRIEWSEGSQDWIHWMNNEVNEWLELSLKFDLWLEPSMRREINKAKKKDGGCRQPQQLILVNLFRLAANSDLMISQFQSCFLGIN